MIKMFETVAYHKNDITVAEKNVLFQKFFISHDTPFREMWLGDGVYFWEKKRDTEWWDGNYEKNTVLSAKLKCNSDQFVNLDVEEEFEEFKQFCEQTKEAMEQSHYSFEFSDGKFQVSSFFYNVFKETYELLLLKYSFPQRNNRPQYCASDNSIISDIRIIGRTIGERLVWC